MPAIYLNQSLKLMSQLSDDKVINFYDKKFGISLNNFVIILKTGTRYSFCYNLITRMKLDGSTLTLAYGGSSNEIIIKGNKLSDLFEDLNSQCVLTIREANKEQMQLITSRGDQYKDLTFIETIIIESE